MKRELIINGITIEANVTIKVEEDFDYNLNEFDQSDLERIRRGELFVATILVRASAEGIEGFDSLGGCVLPPNNMFNSIPFDTGVDLYVSEYKLIENALDDLSKTIVDTALNLKRFA